MSDTEAKIQRLARECLAGSLTPAGFQQALQKLMCADLGDATLDLQRLDRCGFPEVVFAPGKSVPLLREIIATMLDRQIPLLVTRVDPEVARQLNESFPALKYNRHGRTLRSAEACTGAETASGHRREGVIVISAGSSDLTVAEEACETLAWMGVPYQSIRDVGVAGPQRLQRHLDILRGAAAIVVIAGMEGALPSVVAGYVPCPVFAVPTSVGYGANFGGISALLAMLNSCAANVAVCNIDAGFKGAYLAGLVARNSRQP